MSQVDPRRRDQPCDAQDPVEPAQGHGGTPGDDRWRHPPPLADPFLVIATQNLIEYEGTFALPEAQLDYFMLRIRLGYPQPIEEIVILDEQKRTTRSRSSSRSSAWRNCAGSNAVRGLRRFDRRGLHRRVTGSDPNPSGRLPGCVAAGLDRYRAGQALAGLLGRDYVIPDDIEALAEAALAHRLIIKTSSSIHDVQAAQGRARDPRRRADPRASRPTGGEDRPRSARPRRASRPAKRLCLAKPSSGGPAMFRRLQAIALATILVVAAFSTGWDFLFYLLYLGILVVGGSYVLVRLGLSDLEAGYAVSQLHGHVGDRMRVTYTLRNSSRFPKPWLEIHSPTTLPGGLPGRAITLSGQAERSWLIFARH